MTVTEIITKNENKPRALLKAVIDKNFVLMEMYTNFKLHQEILPIFRKSECIRNFSKFVKPLGLKKAQRCVNGKAT